jgi:hypothetical protein
MTINAELSSLATGLEELTARVAAIADKLGRDERESVAPELYEVERSLRTAHRRLARLVSRD